VVIQYKTVLYVYLNYCLRFWSITLYFWIVYIFIVCKIHWCFTFILLIMYYDTSIMSSSLKQLVIQTNIQDMNDDSICKITSPIFYFISGMKLYTPNDIEMTKMSDVEFIGRNKEYRFNWRLTLILEYELFSLLMTLSWLWIVKHQLKALLLCFNVYLTVKLDKNSHVHLYPFLLLWMQCPSHTTYNLIKIICLLHLFC